MARAVAPSALHDLLQELENPAPRVVQASLRQLLDVQDERYRRLLQQRQASSPTAVRSPMQQKPSVRYAEQIVWSCTRADQLIGSVQPAAWQPHPPFHALDAARGARPDPPRSQGGNSRGGAGPATLDLPLVQVQRGGRRPPGGDDHMAGLLGAPGSGGGQHRSHVRVQAARQDPATMPAAGGRIVRAPARPSTDAIGAVLAQDSPRRRRARDRIAGKIGHASANNTQSLPQHSGGRENDAVSDPHAQHVRGRQVHRGANDQVGGLLMGGTLPRDGGNASHRKGYGHGGQVHNPGAKTVGEHGSQAGGGPQPPRRVAAAQVDSMGGLLRGGTPQPPQGHRQVADIPAGAGGGGARATVRHSPIRDAAMRQRQRADHVGGLLQGGTIPGHQGARAPPPAEAPHVRVSDGVRKSSDSMGQLLRGDAIPTMLPDDTRVDSPAASQSVHGGPSRGLEAGDAAPAAAAAVDMRRSRHSFAEEVGVDLDPHSIVDGWYNGGAAGEDIVEAARVQQQQEEARQAAADLETDKLVPVTGVAPAAHVISLSEPSAAHGISRAQLVAKLEHLTGSSSGIAGWVWLCGCVAVCQLTS